MEVQVLSAAQMKGIVYVLFSLKNKRTYVGSTDNLERRFNEHSNGEVNSTKNRLPLKIVYFEETENLDSARKKEHYYKTCAGRKKLKIILSKII